MINYKEITKANPYYSKNTRGLVHCRLCKTDHRDEENFYVHINAKKHTTQLLAMEKIKERFREAEERKKRMLDIEAGIDVDDAETRKAPVAAASSSSSAAQQKRQLPIMNFKHDTDPATRSCRVWIDISFPLADEDCRPLHKWVGSYEQNVVLPRDESSKYLLIACDPYETIAYAFPATLPATNREDHNGNEELFCESWDPVSKSYALYFVLG